MHTRMILGFVLLTVASVVKADGGDLSASRVFEVAAPSIVVVEAHNKDGAMVASGSGVVIAKGVVVSNCHVFTKANTAVVRYRQTSYPAALQYGDTAHDLCSFTVNGLPAPPVQMSSTSSLKVGAPAFAIGAPEGLELTLSGGLISSLRKLADGVVIQMTTPISPGSSGGGLFDAQARLIGITSYYMREGQQLNFALPVEWIRELNNGHGSVTDTARSGVAETSTRALDFSSKADPVSPGLGDDVSLLKKGAERGDPEAQTKLATHYADGVGVQRSYAQAIRWYKTAANQGDANAQFDLGFMYETGEGVRKDLGQAVRWYSQAAKQGHGEAINHLGHLYLTGSGVPQDKRAAAALFEAGANRGNANAQTTLGTMYGAGDGVLMDYSKAAALFRLSADQGDAIGQAGLAVLYQTGAGVPRDVVVAFALYNMALTSGDVEALAPNRSKLMESMSITQVEQGQDLSRRMKSEGVLKALDAYLQK